MFTGIVEAVGEVAKVEISGGNRTFWIRAPFAANLMKGQSIAHDGVCLTVEAIAPSEHIYQVTAVPDTLHRTTLGSWAVGRRMNLERSLRPHSFLDGHIVQGHVDGIAQCVQALSLPDEGRRITFELCDHDSPSPFPVVMKGSIAVDGISLTVAEWQPPRFAVVLIPFTLRHTTAHHWLPGRSVNIEFDVLGKYVFEYQRRLNERNGA